MKNKKIFYVSGALLLSSVLLYSTLGNYVLDYNVTEKYETKNEGYRGYEVNILVPYQSLGFTVSNGLNQFKVCPSYSNAISLAQYNWVYYGTWLKPSTHYTFN